MITKLNPVASLYGLQSKVLQSEGKSPPAVPQLEPGKILSATVMESRGQNIFMLATKDLQFTVSSKIPLAKGEQIQFQVIQTTPVLELQKVDQGSPLQNLQSLSLTGEVVNVKPLLQNLQNSYFATPAANQQTTPSTLQQVNTSQLEKLIHQQNFTVKATVLENAGNDKSLVRIGSETYTVTGQISAKPGESLVLQLQSLKPTMIFFQANNEGVVNKNNLPLLLNTEPQTLPALVKALQLPLVNGFDLLQPFQQKVLHNLQNLQPAQLQQPGAGKLLKTSMEQLGLRSEAMVAQGKGQDAAAQLKSVLAMIVNTFREQEQISSSARHILATIENSQLVQTSLQPENGLLFPLPFSFLEKGYLLVDQEKKKDAEDEIQEKFSCTLHLTLEGLGNVRVRCVQDMESVRIAFYLESQETAEFVSTFQNELKEKISSAPLLSLSFAGGAESPGSALLQRILPAKQPMLDTSA